MNHENTALLLTSLVILVACGIYYRYRCPDCKKAWAIVRTKSYFSGGMLGVSGFKRKTTCLHCNKVKVQSEAFASDSKSPWYWDFFEKKRKR